eukprot:g20922.t1
MCLQASRFFSSVFDIAATPPLNHGFVFMRCRTGKNLYKSPNFDAPSFACLWLPQYLHSGVSDCDENHLYKQLENEMDGVHLRRWEMGVCVSKFETVPKQREKTGLSAFSGDMFEKSVVTTVKEENGPQRQTVSGVVAVPSKRLSFPLRVPPKQQEPADIDKSTTDTNEGMLRPEDDLDRMLGPFRMDGNAFRYSKFVPRFYNLVKSLGFERGKIMPSRAFCSDENQGFAIIKITKHFGTFPFDHGSIGGILEETRHGAHAAHGRDLVIIQASHVGYDPATGHFGSYMRQHCDSPVNSTCCGKICHVLDWYMEHYKFAQNNIRLYEDHGAKLVMIDNELVNQKEGLFLNLERLFLTKTTHHPLPKSAGSTYKIFEATPRFMQHIGPDFVWKPFPGETIKENLHSELFYFHRTLADPKGHDRLEANICFVMPYIVTSKYPALAAARACVQVEFDRSFRTMRDSAVYKGRKVFYIAGLNVDISPKKHVMLPVAYFLPWAAYLQRDDGSGEVWEQGKLFEELCAQSIDNPDAMHFESELNEELNEAKLTHRHAPFKLPAFSFFSSFDKRLPQFHNVSMVLLQRIPDYDSRIL